MGLRPSTCKIGLRPLQPLHINQLDLPYGLHAVSQTFVRQIDI